jgi:hypothetical protein
LTDAYASAAVAGERPTNLGSSISIETRGGVFTRIEMVDGGCGADAEGEVAVVVVDVVAAGVEAHELPEACAVTELMSSAFTQLPVALILSRQVSLGFGS